MIIVHEHWFIWRFFLFDLKEKYLVANIWCFYWEFCNDNDRNNSMGSLTKDFLVWWEGSRRVSRWSKWEQLKSTGVERERAKVIFASLFLIGSAYDWWCTLRISKKECCILEEFLKAIQFKFGTITDPGSTIIDSTTTNQKSKSIATN